MKKLFHVSIVLILLLLPWRVLSSTKAEQKELQKQEQEEALFLKRQNRLLKMETQHQDYFKKKRSHLDKVHQRRLQKIENRKGKIPEVHYQKLKEHTEQWYTKKQKQLDYQEKDFLKKLEIKKKNLQ